VLQAWGWHTYSMNHNEARIYGKAFDLVIVGLENGNVEIGVMGKDRAMGIDTPENYWVGDKADLVQNLAEMASSWQYYELMA
jgi:hypothetical protein